MAPIKGMRDILRLLEAEVSGPREKANKNKSYIHELLRDLRGMKGYILSIQQERSQEFLSMYRWKSYILDYIIFLHTSLFLLCAEKFPLDESNDDVNDEPDKLTMKMRFTTSALTHLINSLFSIYILLEKGLDVQAKQILRSYIEYSDLTLAVLGDEDFYDNYRRMGDGERERKEVWNKFTRPSALTKILERIFIDMDGTREHWNILQQIRKQLYDDLSEYTHGHFMAVLFGAFGEIAGGEITRTPLGAITKRVDSTLINTIDYGYLFIKHIVIAIVKYQKLPFMTFGEEGAKFVMYYKILESFMPAFFLVSSMGKGKSPTKL